MKKPTPSQTFHLSRLVLFGLLAVALLVARSDSGNALRLTYDKNVLAYASNMTIADLLKATNESRSTNGLLPLSLSSTLDTSAQLKANDMIKNNYWSHIAPDGTQPWHWFEKAGYSYAVAGENLAYGFSTGFEVETAWMNSPTHKANVLGDYKDVGFGIASSSNYQGGESTVIVAHYGKPKSAETVAAQATTGSTLSSTAVTTTGSQTGSSVNVLSFLQQGKSPMIATISLGLIAITAAGFALTHRIFMKHAFRSGKRFVLHHPVLDVVALGSTIGLVLTATVGHLL